MLPVIDGHRDTNQTACPGGHLYALLPQIRTRTRALMEEAAKTLLVVSEPGAVSGTAEVGRALTATPGRVDAPDATFTYSWMRNGVPIPGATSPTYTCTAADFGTRLAVSVTAAASKRLPVTEVLTTGSVVTAQPTISLTTRKRGRRAAVKVVVGPAQGFQRVPSGSVVIRVGSREKTTQLVNGVAAARFLRLRSGEKRVSAAYTSTNGYAPATATTTVLIAAS